ncbi:MAG: zinc ribbon domain-containing protein, partial [Acidobacteriota bacterium]|nr:zinc ribbon domain-containing protein [Acidobacteriota bacterium]
LVIMAPIGAEVYVNDERKGSVGSSGRLILNTIPAGRHVLRVAKAGEKDDERVIELREGANEQVIQAQLKPLGKESSQPSSHSSSSRSGAPQSSLMPGIVACKNCHARFAEGVKFCGRCGGGSFTLISEGENKQKNICPRCSANVPTDAKFCGCCGFNFLQTAASIPAQDKKGFSNTSSNPAVSDKICRRCGSSFPPHIKFCGRCGNSLN